MSRRRRIGRCVVFTTVLALGADASRAGQDEHPKCCAPPASPRLVEGEQPPPPPTPAPAPAPAAQEPEKEKKPETPKWDVQNPPGPSKDVAIDVTEGTWMSVDVSP